MNIPEGETMRGDQQEEMAAWFRSLEPIQPKDMVGLWSGVGIPSGHPLDGVLENLNWFGKRFHSDMRADALLFTWRPGRLVPIEPNFFPIGLAIKIAPFGRTFVARHCFSYLQKLLRARGTTASLRLQALDGVETAAMVYDKQPIVDYFRRIDHEGIAGMMCVHDDPRRFFFKLRKLTG
ncbi:GXWXG domain-containing protein [Rhizobium leguminosarum]|uniref:GXWXG domain-containing protein n=1 Tax=Rhizobium TaxID=379 RepID=UPI00161B1082|nr:GXWXG domain-containing protein [Rhizobium leguminosarum]